MEHTEWTDAIRKLKADLEEEIEIFDKVTKTNVDSAVPPVYGPLRNLFIISRDLLDFVEQLRLETLAIRSENEALDSRLQALETK